MSEKKYVTQDFCNERFGRILDKLEVIDGKVDDLRNEKRKGSRDWKLFAFALTSGISGGIIVTLVEWGLRSL